MQASPLRPALIRSGPQTISIPVLFENRSLLALDKPAGWILATAPNHHARHNLQAALESAIASRADWVRHRNLRFLRFLHRLDAETTGVLLLAKSQGAIAPYSKLFASRAVTKIYWAITEGQPSKQSWTCRLSLAPDPVRRGRMTTTSQPQGRDAVTHFKVLATLPDAHAPRTLIEAAPLTGRTHQIRVHLAAEGLSVVGDALYAKPGKVPGRSCRPGPLFPMGLRAVQVAFQDPFEKQPVLIQAPVEGFLDGFGFPITLSAMLSPKGRPDATALQPGSRSSFL